MNDWECLPFEHTSPAGLTRFSDADCYKDNKWAIRAVVKENEPKSFMEVGARAAFWDFNKPLLDRLAMDNIPKITIPGGSSLFSTFFKLIKQVLKVQDEDVVQILGTRLGLKSGAGSNLEEFLQLDEACQALDECEKKALTSEQKVLSAEVAQVREFKQHWKERKAKLPSEIAKAKARAAAAKPAAAPKAKGKAKAKAAVAPPPPVPPTLPDDIDEQADMRQFVPPGGYLCGGQTQAMHGVDIFPLMQG